MIEYLSIVLLLLNDFFARHIVFISHMLAAVFLVLTETTVNMRIVTPMLEWTQDMILSKIPFVPNILTTVFFIIWVTIALFIYQAIFQWFLLRYADHLTSILVVAFILITLGINIKYRD